MGLDLYFEVRNTLDKNDAYEVGYFRKVNFLVSFFDSMCEGLGNLEPVVISKDHIENLIERCSEVLENHELASELLPTVGGFFFGDTDYDEYYFEDVEQVLNYCKDDLLPIFDNLDDDEEVIFNIWY